jgi:hypothetical protein
MSLSIRKQIENVVASLRDRGMGDKAALVEKIATGMFERWDVGRRPGLPPMHPRVKEPTEIAPTGQKQFAQKGELVEELDTSGAGNHRYILYGIKKPMTMDELDDAVKKGYLATEYFNEQFQSAKDPNSKKFFKTMLDKSLAYSRAKAAAHLESLSTLMFNKGYEAISHRLKKAAQDVSMEVKRLIEKHEIPSLELLHEKSGSPEQFEQTVQKLVSAYEDAAKIIKEFDKKYIEKVMNPLLKKEFDSDGASRETMQLVRKSDSEIDSKMREISRNI